MGINVTVLIIAFVLAIEFLAVSAHQAVRADGDHGGTVDEVLEEVLSSRNLATVDQLSCEDVTDSEWEELGEAVMSLAHPDPDQHAAMDQMMGGEGSETLKQAHINMGQAYAGCASGSYGMMGGMLATNPSGASGSGMGWFTNMGQGQGAWGWFGALLMWLIVFAVIFLVVRLLAMGNLSPRISKSALDILNERYAKGEIDKQQLEEMRKELTA